MQERRVTSAELMVERQDGLFGGGRDLPLGDGYAFAKFALHLLGGVYASVYNTQSYHHIVPTNLDLKVVLERSNEVRKLLVSIILRAKLRLVS